MYPSIFHMYVMNDINKQLNKSSELSELRKENEDLKKQINDLQNRLKWVIDSKNEIYDKYIKIIINNSIKK